MKVGCEVGVREKWMVEGGCGRVREDVAGEDSDVTELQTVGVYG